ncbi:MAG: UvrD-helicase domain-containing protein [Clostridia bacterium]
MSKTEKWNNQQIEILDENKFNKNMLVSASAGSGKTTVLIERIKKIIVAGTPLERIVMLSFNKSIASEMRQKLVSKLIEEAQNGTIINNLERQIDDIALCNITTVDGFCNSIIKEYYYELDIDPNFDIAEGDETDVLKQKALDKTLLAFYNDKIYLELKGYFDGRGNAQFKTALLQTYDFLVSLKDKNEFLNNIIAETQKPINDKIIVKYFLSYLKQQIDEMAQKVEPIKAQLKQFDNENIKNILGCYEGLKAINSIEDVFATFATIAKPRRAGRMKDEVLKDLINECANPVINIIEKFAKFNNEECFVSDLEKNSKYVTKVVQILQSFIANYTQEKQKYNKFDFGDLSFYAYQILLKEDVVKEIKAKYDYICVDEYQDINYLQDFIITSISKGDNLFMVGDSKQSIYKFRMSEPKIFMDRYKEYLTNANGYAQNLSYNYRSDFDILDFVNKVFCSLMKDNFGGIDYEKNSQFLTELKFDKYTNLQAVNIDFFIKKKTQKLNLPDDNIYSVKEHNAIKQFTSVEAEANFIYNKINQILGADIYDVKTKDKRKIKLNDIAILAKSRTPRVNEILNILTEKGLPLTSGLRQKTDSQDVNLLVDVLTVSLNDKNDLALINVMLSYFGNFTPQDLADIRKNKKATQSEPYFWQAVKQYDIKGGLAKKIEIFYEKLNYFNSLSKFLNAYEMLRKLVDDGFLYHLKISEQGIDRWQKVKTFLNIISASVVGKGTVGEFLNYFNKENSKIEINTNYDTDYIITSTVHGSKGLEYPVVFLIDCGGFSKNESSKIFFDSELGLAIGNFDAEERSSSFAFTKEVVGMKRAKELTEERLRLFYVALTRAKNFMFLTGEVSENYGKSDSDSSFANWISKANADGRLDKYITLHNLDEEIVETEKKQKIDVDFKKPNKNIAKELAKYLDFSYPYINSTKTSIKYSVTDINISSDGEVVVPKLFAEENTSVGTLYHKIMQYIDYEKNSKEEINLQLNVMLKQNLFSAKDLENVNIDEIFDCLNNPLMVYASKNNCFREKTFLQNILANEVLDIKSDEDILLQGTIDLLVFGKQNMVIDFKKSSQSPQAIIERYKKQLNIYANAVNDAYKIDVKKYIYVFGRNLVLEV